MKRASTGTTLRTERDEMTSELTASNNPAMPPRSASLLTLSGAIPFIAAAIAAFVLPPEHHARLLYAASTYAAVILSFLGGIQWGLGVSLHDAAPRSARTLFVVSVSVSLAGWCLLFIEPASLRLGCAAGLFACVWAIDGLLRLQALIPAWFFRLRSAATFIVVGALLTLAMKL